MSKFTSSHSLLIRFFFFSIAPFYRKLQRNSNQITLHVSSSFSAYETKRNQDHNKTKPNHNPRPHDSKIHALRFLLMVFLQRRSVYAIFFSSMDDQTRRTTFQLISLFSYEGFSPAISSVLMDLLATDFSYTNYIAECHH